jgi:isocitrate dehydrogenase
MSLEREKESNRTSSNNQKTELEREKLMVQQNIADKQLQVARENKNKYDVKGKSDNKK